MAKGKRSKADEALLKKILGILNKKVPPDPAKHEREFVAAIRRLPVGRAHLDTVAGGS